MYEKEKSSHSRLIKLASFQASVQSHQHHQHLELSCIEPEEIFNQPKKEEVSRSLKKNSLINNSHRRRPLDREPLHRAVSSGAYVGRRECRSVWQRELCERGYFNIDLDNATCFNAVCWFLYSFLHRSLAFFHPTYQVRHKHSLHYMMPCVCGIHIRRLAPVTGCCGSPLRTLIMNSKLRERNNSLRHTALNLAEELKHLKLDFAIFHIHHGTYSVFFTSSLALTTSSTAV